MEPQATSAFSVDGTIQYASNNATINSYYYSPTDPVTGPIVFVPSNGLNTAQYPANNGFPVKIVTPLTGDQVESANPPAPILPTDPVNALFGYTADATQYGIADSYYQQTGRASQQPGPLASPTFFPSNNGFQPWVPPFNDQPFKSGTANVGAEAVVPSADQPYYIETPQAGPVPPGPTPEPTVLNSVAMMTFLIQGPRYNTSYTNVLDYYINCDAVGYQPPSPVQEFGSWYMGTSTANSTTWPSQAGQILKDFDQSDNSVRSRNTLLDLQGTGPTPRSLACISYGGYYADVMGLFGPYTVPGSVAPTYAASDVAKSICCKLLKVGTNNPLNWSDSGWSDYGWNGLNLDFENIGFGGNPNVSNTYPPLPTTIPSFPADATDPKYSGYPQAIVDFIQTMYAVAPAKLLTHAPLSIAINGDGGQAPGGTGRSLGGNVAITTALNTWFAFSNSSVVPSTANYNNAPSLAMNHPSQLQYFDDIFVQFYNAGADDYIGGKNFANILAQWGYVCLLAQKLGKKTPKVNLGFAYGTIDSANAQGPTAPAPSPPNPSNSAPYTYWYPQYKTASPPNPSATTTGFIFPNIGTTIDGPNLNDALVSANAMLRASGLPNTSAINVWDWCSGIGFWAGENAVGALNDAYAYPRNQTPNLPKGGYCYSWSDAYYPAPPITDAWGRNYPIDVNIAPP